MPEDYKLHLGCTQCHKAVDQLVRKVTWPHHGNKPVAKEKGILQIHRTKKNDHEHAQFFGLFFSRMDMKNIWVKMRDYCWWTSSDHMSVPLQQAWGSCISTGQCSADIAHHSCMKIEGGIPVERLDLRNNTMKYEIEDRMEASSLFWYHCVVGLVHKHSKFLSTWRHMS